MKRKRTLVYLYFIDSFPQNGPQNRRVKQTPSENLSCFGHRAKFDSRRANTEISGGLASAGLFRYKFFDYLFFIFAIKITIHDGKKYHIIVPNIPK